MHFTFAWRYFKAKKSANAINIISWVTTGVIAFSTMCQVLVLSVFNGFEDLVRSLYSSFYSDLKVVPFSGKTFNLTPEQILSIRKSTGIKNLSLIAEEKALIQNVDLHLQTVVLLKGVDDHYDQVSGVPKKMQNGTFNTGTIDNPLLILGSGIENAIGIKADRNLDQLTVFLPRRTDYETSDPLTSLSEGNANTSGSFAIQQDFDDKYAITNLAFIKQQMNFKPDEYNAAEIAIMDSARLNPEKEVLQHLLGPSFTVQTKFEQNITLYNSMRLEKWVIFAIMTLILIIAAFTMISALTMLVLEKRKDINVLQSMGASTTMIKKIFLSEGFILAAFGIVIGFSLAILICFLQDKYRLIKLQGNSFLIDYFPVKLILSDFLLVASTALIIAIIGSWFPAHKASIQTFELRN